MHKNNSNLMASPGNFHKLGQATKAWGMVCVGEHGKGNWLRDKKIEGCCLSSVPEPEAGLSSSSRISPQASLMVQW